MALFGKTKKAAGWFAVRLHNDGISAAYIKRVPAAKPVVETTVFVPSGSSAAAETLAKLAKELHLDRYQCSNLLSAGEYQVVSVDSPNVAPDELKTAIRWRLKDMLDFRVDDATIDVLDVPVDKNAPVRNHSLYAVVARNQVISQRQALFAEEKIPLNVIDIQEMAQRNIAALLEPEGRGLAMLSFDSEGGLLTVSFGGELYLARRIEVTSAQFGQQDEAQKNAVFDKVTLELQRSLDHFDRQYHFIAISKLILLAPATGLQEYLASNLYIPVEAFDLESVFDISRTPDLKTPEMQQRCFLTLGAALRQEEKAL